MAAHIHLSKLVIHASTPWQALECITSKHPGNQVFMIHYQDQVYKLRIEKQDAYQTYQTYQTYQLNMMNTMVMTVKPDQAFVTVGYEFVFQRNMSNQIVHFSIALARKLGAAQLLLDNSEAVVVQVFQGRDWLDMMQQKPTWYQQFGFEYISNNAKKAQLVAAMHAKQPTSYYANLMKKYQTVLLQAIQEPHCWLLNNKPIDKDRLDMLRSQAADLPSFAKAFNKCLTLAGLAKHYPGKALLLGTAVKLVLTKTSAKSTKSTKTNTQNTNTLNRTTKLARLTKTMPTAWFGGFGLVAKFSKLLPQKMRLLLN
jgi:hypothetical protein